MNVALLVGAIVAIIFIFSNAKPQTCAETGEVKEIVSIAGRDATVKLVTGELKVVNQAHLKPGDTYCLRYAPSK